MMHNQKKANFAVSAAVNENHSSTHYMYKNSKFPSSLRERDHHQSIAFLQEEKKQKQTKKGRRENNFCYFLSSLDT